MKTKAQTNVHPKRQFHLAHSTTWRMLVPLLVLVGLGCRQNNDTQVQSDAPVNIAHELASLPNESTPLSNEAHSREPDWPFVESAVALGLNFTHTNGMTGQFHFPEIMGSGVGVLDYDLDGDLDVYLVQGGKVKMIGESPSGLSQQRATRTDRLFRNDLVSDPAKNSSWRFTDVTDSSGISSQGFGMGVAVGDFNHDGFPDLFVTNYGPNTWLLNRGDGTFQDVTHSIGVEDNDSWSSSASFLDFDRDGLLDLYVCEYLDYTIHNRVDCTNSRSDKDYCGPEVYAPLSDRLYRNRGDGTFEDVSASAGIHARKGAGLGVVAGDFNGDHWLDLFVANDGMANFLWINQGDGTFKDEALLAGCAFNLFGIQEAGMGVDAADFDHDGDLDLFMTHLMGEKNTLYLNDGSGTFEDRSLHYGLDQVSRPYTAFGVGWFDFDLDGDLDLYAVNGAVKQIDTLDRTVNEYRYAMPDQLFENRSGRYVEIQAGSGFQTPAISRGSVEADLDNDGDPDLLVNDINGPVRLLLNQTPRTSQWIGFQILREDSGSDWTGARVALLKDGKPVAWRTVRTDGSYCSSRDPRISIGLKPMEFDGVRIVLPNGDERQLKPSELEVGRYHRIVL